MGIMSCENESMYQKEKFPLLSCAMAIELRVLHFASRFLSFRTRHFAVAQPLLTTY